MQTTNNDRYRAAIDIPADTNRNIVLALIKKHYSRDPIIKEAGNVLRVKMYSDQAFSEQLIINQLIAAGITICNVICYQAIV